MAMPLQASLPPGAPLPAMPQVGGSLTFSVAGPHGPQQVTVMQQPGVQVVLPGQQPPPGQPMPVPGAPVAQAVAVPPSMARAQGPPMTMPGQSGPATAPPPGHPG